MKTKNIVALTTIIVIIVIALVLVIISKGDFGATGNQILDFSNKKPKPAPNPCGTDNAKCSCCMAYAEAGGKNIPDECMAAVKCVINNRINNKDFPPTPKNACDVVSQGGGTQFNPYKCVGNPNYANQKYCNCCSEKLSGAEKDEADKACGNLPACDCNGANSFVNAGLSPPGKNCEKVSVPCCSTFDFYICRPKPAKKSIATLIPKLRPSTY